MCIWDLEGLQSCESFLPGLRLPWNSSSPGLLSYEDGGSMDLRSAGILPRQYTTSQPRIPWPEFSLTFVLVYKSLAVTSLHHKLHAHLLPSCSTVRRKRGISKQINGSALLKLTIFRSICSIILWMLFKLHKASIRTIFYCINFLDIIEIWFVNCFRRLDILYLCKLNALPSSTCTEIVYTYLLALILCSPHSVAQYYKYMSVHPKVSGLSW